MASPLTSASLKSGFFYLFLLVGIVLAVLYFLFFQQPNVIDNLNRQAFRLNYSAFSNGIKFANYRFITNQLKNNQTNGLDQWITGEIGLDYNLAGFPIGTEISNPAQQFPQTAKDCLQLWQFVLGPLQPKISLLQKGDGYWASLTTDKVCVYRSAQIEELSIYYDISEGKVSLTDVN